MAGPLSHLRRQVPDLALRAKLTPDYQIGRKALLVSSDYYPALVRDTVDLVTDPISRITADGVVTADGTEREADTVVYGTDLNEAWRRDGRNAHLGITVAGFPNLFLLLGPITLLGHTSVVFMIEAQVRYVMQALSLLRGRGGASYVEARPEAQRRFTRAVWHSPSTTGGAPAASSRASTSSALRSSLFAITRAGCNFPRWR